MKEHLKIKALSLGAEARIIRQQETRASKIARKLYEEGKMRARATQLAVADSYYRHRLDVVRPEARCSCLAYGFLKGRRYKQLEAKTRENNAPNWDRVTSLVSKFGRLDRRVAAQKIAEWSDAA